MSWLNIKYIFLLALLISSCSKPTSALEEEGLTLIPPVSIDFSDILERNELRVAVDYSATTYFLYKGQPVGFEYELLRRYANMGVNLKIIIQPSIKESFLNHN